MDNSRQADNARARGRICIDRTATVIMASKLMRSLHVDELVVVDRDHGVAIPLGVLSAQHIVTRILATELDPGVLTAGDIAWTETGRRAGAAIARIAVDVGGRQPDPAGVRLQR